MKELWDDKGRKLEGDSEKAEALVKRNFITDRETNDDNEQEGEGGREVDRGSKEWEEYKSEAKEALRTTKNSSAPGPDGINYKAIKTILATPLGEALLDEVADSLYTGEIPNVWREMKVVMIPKPGKDHQQAKAWRPINLINCIGKIGEKVVANRLQEAGLLHDLQFGSVKERSSIDAIVRVVTRAQRC